MKWGAMEGSCERVMGGVESLSLGVSEEGI